MRIFLTGASGFIGSRILPALQASGHQVIGLARSEHRTGPEGGRRRGASRHAGCPESLLAGVGNADAVIHTAFDHDFSRFAANCEKDRRDPGPGPGAARQHAAAGDHLRHADGRRRERRPGPESFFNSTHPSPRTASELAGQQLLEAGVDVRWSAYRRCMTPCVRTADLHIERAVANGAVALRGEGSNRWSAAHVDDVARLSARCFRARPASAIMRWPKRIALRDIAAVIAHGLNLPLTHRMTRRSTPVRLVCAVYRP